MPTFSASQVPPPKNWQEFESLCWDLWRHIWDDPSAQRNGRLGQPQCGVDVFGRRGERWCGLQARGKDNLADSQMTVAELQAAIQKAKNFKPTLSEFFVATTGPKDVAIEQAAREVTEAHRKTRQFAVTVLGWADILVLLEDYPDVIAKFYPWLRSISWRVEAVRAAEYVHKHLFSAHRGAILWCPYTTAIFGNDGYDPQPTSMEIAKDNRAKMEVTALRNRLHDLQHAELAFGLDKSGYSWAMLVDSGNAEAMFELVWECYPIFPAYSHEKTSAFVDLRSYVRAPVNPHCCRG